MSDTAARFVEVFRSFCGDDLRDLWAFDYHGYEHLYIRGDVSDALKCLDISQFIDNERSEYIAGNTHGTLYYADYGYTVRRFDSLEQFRAFVGDRPTRTLAGFDHGTGRDFAALHDRVCALNDKFDGVDLFNDPAARDRLP